MGGEDTGLDVRALEETALGAALRFTRVEVCEKAGVPLDEAEELWQQLGFPHAADDDVAFTDADVEALSLTRELVDLGVLTPDSQAALVRTWGRSFARLAEWQVGLLTRIAVEGDDPAALVGDLTEKVLPNVEQLQAYVWRRHLAGAIGRLLEQGGDSSTVSTAQAVGFVDIVGFTGRSRQLTETELVAWVEGFEDLLTRSIVEAGGRVIKTIGDEVLFVTDTPAAAAEIALTATERGTDPDDDFPQVRAGIAYGAVVSRLGDVLGPTVNVAARLTSVARPGTVLLDRGAHEALQALAQEDPAEGVDAAEQSRLAALVDRAAEELADLSPYSEFSGFRFRRIPRTSVKGYSRLEAWAVRRPR